MLHRYAATLTLLLAASAASAVETGDTAPAWAARDFSGNTIEFPAATAGKPTVMVFWATWCGYCRAFMPYLKDISADYAAHGVEVVAINAKEDGEGNPRAYVRGLGFSPIAIAEGDEIAAAYGIEFIPGLLIVDGTGTVAYRRPWTDLPAGRTVAELWDAQVRDALDRLL
jgi:thiol-disulfide isomerase/thioredoxin